jgi:hypothetical protein
MDPDKRAKVFVRGEWEFVFLVRLQFAYLCRERVQTAELRQREKKKKKKKKQYVLT